MEFIYKNNLIIRIFFKKIDENDTKNWQLNCKSVLLLKRILFFLRIFAMLSNI